MKEDLHIPGANKSRSLDVFGPVFSREDEMLHELLRLRPVEEVQIVLVGEEQLADAEGFLASCEACSEFSEVAFEYLLDAVTESDPSMTEYLLPRPAKCPCGRDVTEKTLVSPL